MLSSNSDEPVDERAGEGDGAFEVTNGMNTGADSAPGCVEAVAALSDVIEGSGNDAAVDAIVDGNM
jgi:hypothetical protein